MDGSPGRGVLKVTVLSLCAVGGAGLAGGVPAAAPASRPFRAPSMWEYSAPLIAPRAGMQDRCRALKDPSVVFHGGKWHVFMTAKLPGRTAIEYCSFADWGDANGAKRTLLNISHGELIRDGHDEHLVVDPEQLRFVFQGMWDKDKKGKGYGAF